MIGLERGFIVGAEVYIEDVKSQRRVMKNSGKDRQHLEKHLILV